MWFQHIVEMCADWKELQTGDPKVPVLDWRQE